MAETCFMTFKTNFVLGKGVKFASDELNRLQSQVIAGVHNGLPSYFVYVDGKLIGLIPQPWSAGMAGLAKAQLLCKTLGKVAHDSRSPDVITLEISLFSAPSKVPVAVQILQQHGVPTWLVSKPPVATANPHSEPLPPPVMGTKAVSVASIPSGNVNTDSLLQSSPTNLTNSISQISSSNLPSNPLSTSVVPSVSVAAVFPKIAPLKLSNSSAPSEFSQNATQSHALPMSNPIVPNNLAKPVLKFVSDHCVECVHVDTQDISNMNLKNCLSSTPNKCHNPSLDEGVTHKPILNGIVITDEPEQVDNQHLPSRSKARDRCSTDSGITLDDSAKEDDNSVIVVDSSDDNGIREENSDIDTVEIIDSPKRKPNETSEDDSSKTLVYTQSAYTVSILGKEVRVLVKEEKTIDKETLSKPIAVSTKQNSISLVTYSDSDSNNVGEAQVPMKIENMLEDSNSCVLSRNEAEVNSCQAIAIFNSTKSDVKVTQGVKPDAKPFQLVATDCKPGPSGCSSADVKPGMKPFQLAITDSEQGLSSCSQTEDIKHVISSGSCPGGSSGCSLTGDVKPGIAPGRSSSCFSTLDVKPSIAPGRSSSCFSTIDVKPSIAPGGSSGCSLTGDVKPGIAPGRSSSCFSTIDVKPSIAPGGSSGCSLTGDVKPGIAPGRSSSCFSTIDVKPGIAPGRSSSCFSTIDVKPSIAPGRSSSCSSTVDVKPSIALGRSSSCSSTVDVKPSIAPGRSSSCSSTVDVKPSIAPGRSSSCSSTVDVKPSIAPGRSSICSSTVDVKPSIAPGRSSICSSTVDVKPSIAPGRSSSCSSTVDVKPSIAPGRSSSCSSTVDVKPSIAPGRSSSCSSTVDIKPSIAPGWGPVYNADLNMMKQFANGSPIDDCTFDSPVDSSDGVKDGEDSDIPLPLNINEVDKLFEESLPEFDKSTMTEPAQVITTPLFPHQKQALKWMIDRENGTGLAPFWQRKDRGSWYNKGTRETTDERPHTARGGILADDMGLGKTLVVISLILTNHINGKPMFSKKRPHGTQIREEEQKKSDSEVGEPAVKKSSFSAGCSKDSECDEKNDGAIKLVVKKNRAKRMVDNKSLKQPGFAFRQLMLPKLTAGKSEKKIKKEKKRPKNTLSKEHEEEPWLTTRVSVSSTDDSGDDMDASIPLASGASSLGSNIPKRPSTSTNQGGSATLILCPVSVISNWADQLSTHIHHKVKLQVYMYHGPDRVRDVNFLSEQDIVISTYSTLSNDYNMKGNSPLHKIFWLRIILDEGHIIRNERTNQTKSTLLLKGQRRWALTGTPIQNRTEDLYSVLCFLRLSPFNNRQWWNMTLGGAVKRGDPRALARLQRLVRHVSLRRLKTDQVNGRPLVKLPERKVIVQDIELSQEERDVYDVMQARGQLIIKRYFDRGTVLKHYAHCFAILMKLRQLCLHINLCSKKELDRLQSLQSFRSGGDSDSDDDDLENDQSTLRLINELLHLLSSGVDEECSICLDSLVDPVITRCVHAFCQRCISDVINSDILESRCPLCRAPVNKNELVKVPEQRRKEKSDKERERCAGNEWKSSTKVDHLIATLEALREKDPMIKSLVVSQFTSFLDIIEIPLEKNGFQFVRLDGTMAQERRAEAIEVFSDPSPSSPTVFLLSLTAGGVGLNLTAATQIFLMDPAWNPAVEEQCFDRCHRMGQTKDVTVTKYIVPDSVEERMLKLQETKRELMNQAFGNKRQNQEERRKARIEDIRNLIGL